MRLLPALREPASQAEFAEAVGISGAAVSQMVTAGHLERGATAHEWLRAYCSRLREQAAGRASGEAGGLDLVQERAALAKSQREAQDMKNAVARGEYAPIGLLADVLGAAASAVVDRFEQLDGALKKACPDLPESSRVAVQKVIASARNEWIRSTASIVEAHLRAAQEAEDDDGGEMVDA